MCIGHCHYSIHHSGQEGITIAFFSWFMDRQQFQEQTVTGVASLRIAVPKGIKFDLMLYGTVVYRIKYWCSLWHKGKQLRHRIIEERRRMWKRLAKMVMVISKVQSGPKNNGIYKLKCRGEYRPSYSITTLMYATRSKSLNISFVEGQH